MNDHRGGFREHAVMGGAGLCPSVALLVLGFVSA
jgi:hypothetical protein